jgi:hypothetical protein
MKQTVYEEIQRMNLLSSYDNSKTLSEQNNRILKEASQEVYKKLYEKFPCMLNLKDAQYIDDASNEGIDFEKSRYIMWNGFHYYPDGTKYGKNGIERFTCDSPEFKTQTQKVDGKVTQVSKQKSNQVVNQVSIPSQLGGNKEGVIKFQDWLDKYHGDNIEGAGEGWAKSYIGGIINKGKNGGGYGTFGPRTQKAWKNPTYRYWYLKTLEKPAEETPEKEPDTQQPNTQQPDTQQPDTQQPNTQQPDTQQPNTQQPNTQQPAATTEGPKGQYYTDEKTGGFYKWNGTEYEFQSNYLASDGIVYTWDGTRYVGAE